jgi:hypothetical protein
MQRISIALALGTLLTSGTLISQATSISADSNGSASVVCGQTGCTITVKTPGSPGGSSGDSGGSSSSDPWACAWQTITAETAQTLENSITPPPLIHDGAPGPNDNWYLAYCQQVDTSNYAFYLVEVNGTLPIVTPAQVGQMAVSELDFVAPMVSMAPPGPAFVNFESWLWVDQWQTIIKIAMVGGISATATATPKYVIWQMGQGQGQVRCDSAGAVYNPQIPDEDQSTSCGYTYQVASQPGQAYTVTATVYYDVSWTSTVNGVTSPPDDLGVMPGLPKPTSLVVDEIGTVVVGS